MKKINICIGSLCQKSSIKYLSYLFVAVTFLVYGFLFTKVYSESGNITQINFTSSPQTIDADSLSSVISIQTQNTLGELEKTSETTHLILHSSSPTGQFYNANSSACTSLIDSPFTVTMSKGTANKNFCYKDSTPGTYTLDVSVEGTTWTSATQDVVINSLSTPPIEEPEFTEVGGVIGEDTTWTKAKSPYVVTEDIVVNEGVILTIEPGVVVKFNAGNNVSLYAFGKIIANGENGNEIYFTSNYDEVGGSTDEDYEDCNYESYDEEGNPVGNEICEMIDFYEPSASDWDGLYFMNSSGSILNNVYIKYAHDAVYLESSDVDFENLNILNSFSGITGYNNSHVDILNGSISALEENAFVFFTDSTLTVQGVTVSDVYNGFTFFGNSDLNIKDSSLSCSNDGLTFYNNSNLKLTQMNINCDHDGVVLFNDVGVDINEVKIFGATDAGVIAFNNTNPDTIKIKKSEIKENEYGFIIWDSVFKASQNSIYGNRSKGVDTYSEIPLDFSSNYWGDKTGPKNLSTNPLALGNEVSDHVTYKPFLKVKPGGEALSNIMFIPGFQASRMYKMVGDSELGTEFENKLWEPGIIGNVSGMYMDNNGESIDKGVYTRDIVDEAKVLGLNTMNFYKSFISKLDGMVSKGEISAWKPIAYDWRQSQLDIVNRGIEKANGNISYTEELTADQVPYIIGELQKLVDSSNGGKVTIVTHSNGGLVAKALIAKLIEMKNSGKNDLIDKIDNLIEVAPPLAGTPKAMMGILHGYDQGMFYNVFLGRKKARDFGLGITGAYGLLPSSEYISKIENDQIILDNSLDKVNNWRAKYGNSIDTYEELDSFLVNADKSRVQPSYDDLVNPTIVNKKLLDKANVLHEMIDNLVIPDTIQVHQVIGWGLPTPYDMHYKSKNECLLFSKFLCLKKKFVLSSDVDFTSGGDGTVVGSSAAFGDGKEYYLNLKTYNDKPGILDRDHSDIFEVSYLFDLIHNIIKSDSTLPEYLTSTAPSPVDYTVLKMRSPVSMDIYDENNLHTGAEEEGIPNSLYMEFGDDKYLVVPKEGNYILKLAGLSDGIFTLEQEETIGDKSGGTVVFQDIPTTSLLRGEINIKDGALLESISIDQKGDGTFENIKPTNINTEEEPKDEEIKTTERHSEGYSQVLALGMSSPREKDNLKENIGERIIEKKVQDYTKKTNKISQIKGDNVNEKISPKENTLSASAGSVYSSNPIRFKLQLVIVGSFVLLLLALKFIFKVL